MSNLSPEAQLFSIVPDPLGLPELSVSGRPVLPPEVEGEVVKLSGSAYGKQAQAGASRKGNFIVIVSLPRLQGGTGHLPAKGVAAEVTAFDRLS